LIQNDGVIEYNALQINALKEEDIEKLNQKLMIMQNMPNNNIGLTLIFRRFREMDVQNQK
jgi:hypothetical protein